MKKLEGESFGVDVSENKKYLPSFTITAKDLPAIKNWEVGNTYEVKIKVKMESLTEKEERTRAELEIQGIEVVENKKSFEQDYADRRSKKT